jgi:hypothetical protein
MSINAAMFFGGDWKSIDNYNGLLSYASSSFQGFSGQWGQASQ